MILLKNNFLILSVIQLLIIALMFTSCKKEEVEVEDNFPAITVKVINGCGFQGVAANFRDFLVRYNIDVRGTENARKFIFNRTIIVVKHEDEQDLQRLMRYTGITRRIYALSEHSNEAFHIIVGNDYREYLK